VWHRSFCRRPLFLRFSLNLWSHWQRTSRLHCGQANTAELLLVHELPAALTFTRPYASASIARTRRASAPAAYSATAPVLHLAPSAIRPWSWVSSALNLQAGCRRSPLFSCCRHPVLLSTSESLPHHQDHGFWYSLESCFAIFFANYKSISIHIHIISCRAPRKGSWNSRSGSWRGVRSSAVDPVVESHLTVERFWIFSATRQAPVHLPPPLCLQNFITYMLH
jgi:hypothetical protein